MASRRGRAPLSILLVGLTGAACGKSVDGVAPVGGEEPSAVEIERFARRLHLDLTGRPAPDDYLADAVAELQAEGGAPARAALADRLIETDAFAETYVGELANLVFGGEDPDDRYAEICSIVRDGDPRCADCPPAGADLCGGCECAPLVAIRADRQAVVEAAADLAGGATTGEVDRRFAESSALVGFSGPEALADLLFEFFLGRPAEADEQVNAASMILGALIPDSPAGLLFHRHGADYQDLLDILFESEVYREAAVGAAFGRYLGRPVRLAEMAHFSAGLDAAAPDVRPVIRAVVSSQEYFQQ